MCWDISNDSLGVFVLTRARVLICFLMLVVLHDRDQYNAHACFFIFFDVYQGTVVHGYPHGHGVRTTAATTAGTVSIYTSTNSTSLRTRI